VLAGYIASAEINAAAEKGVYAFNKHFVMNDQETNRCTGLLTYSDEQAIREIYMKPFELVVKNFDFEGHKPLAVMSSFNFIGDIWAGSNYDLLNDVLRGEWGFKGMVLTDWNGSYGYQNTDDAIRNGNDLMLGFMQHQSNVLTDLDSPTLVNALRQASKNILFTVGNSGYYTNPTQESGMDKMTAIFVAIDVAVVLVVVAIMAVVILRWRKKQQKAQ
jgi:beta-glucosidase